MFPTQALQEQNILLEKKETLYGARVAMVGDVAYS